MPGRHQERPLGRRGLRWLSGAAGLAVAGAAVFAMTPASAAGSTTPAQLSLSGVATQGNVLGGTTIGVHPGDTVDFQASALPTAGLTNIPTIGAALNSLLGGLTGSQYQVVAHFSASFPGGARTVTLGGPTSGQCKGATDLPVTFPSTGTYAFSWTVQYVAPGLFGCSVGGPNGSDLNLLKSAGVALNAANQWTGQIVVATNPPPPGISIQLPSLGAAPSLPVVGNLPTLSLPSLTLPTIPLNVPSIVSGLPLPGAPGSSSGNPGGGTSGGGTSPVVPVPAPTGECVPCEVVPNPTAFPGFGAVGPDAGSVTHLGSLLPDGQGASSAAPQPSSSSAPVTTTTKTIDLAANKAPAAQMPVVLAIIAIIALSLVTATYARLYLLRRNV